MILGILQLQSNHEMRRKLLDSVASPTDVDPDQPDIIAQEPGEPIYNDRLKRFKFRLDKIRVVGDETAEEFWYMYKGRGNPPVKGVWADADTNSMVILAAREADQALRDTLAEWEGLSTGIDVREDDSLECQRRQLQVRRRLAIQQVAAQRMKIIEAQLSTLKTEAEKRKDLQKELDQLRGETKG